MTKFPIGFSFRFVFRMFIVYYLLIMELDPVCHENWASVEAELLPGEGRRPDCRNPKIEVSLSFYVKFVWH